MKDIFLMGATGSVGQQTLQVLDSYPDRFRLVAFSFYGQVDLARKILRDFSPSLVVAGSKKIATQLQLEYPKVQVLYGEKGLQRAACSDYDMMVNAITGSRGLFPTLTAIKHQREIALSNKETLVMAGDLVMAKAKQYGVTILPLDSEHSAIFQVLQGLAKKDIRKLILTASGGSFLDKSRKELQTVTKEEALKHPNWSMGEKITIDSSTMVNKGLEVIEAHHLFEVDYDQIEVLLHRESVVHSLVETKDGALFSQMGASDMREPIQFALTYPFHLPLLGEKPFSLTDLDGLHFEKMDFDRFPMLALAFEVGRLGGTYPAVYNAANEVAVTGFLQGKIHYLDIERCIKKAVFEHAEVADMSLEALIAIDHQTRTRVERWLECPQELLGF